MTELKASSAEEYATLTTSDEEIALVPMPSGAVFKMRRADIQGLVLIGALPQTLVNTGLKAWREQGKAPTADAVVAEQSPEDTLRQLIFMRQTVVENVLEPRIGYDETGVVALFGKDGQPIARLKKQDFRYAFRWITRQEGQEAPGLESFRNRQERRASASKSGRKKLRRETFAAD